jgi:tetratricopeptide (TPR) repeat protein
MKPLLTRIEEELAVCTDPYRRAELMGEKGCYLARVGDFSAARALVSELRADSSIVGNERVAVRVMLLEGLLLFFEELDAKCRDRVLRAHAISHAAGHIDLARLTAAWLAHADVNLDRFSDVTKMLRYALTPPSPLGDPATVRAHLVLADCNMLAGRIESARRFYELARRGAVECGDDSALAATFYNRAIMMLNLGRIRALLGEESSESRRFMELEVRSVSLYHQASGQTSLSQLLDIMRAMLMFAGGSFSEAEVYYRKILSTGRSLNFDADDSILALEFAYCLLSLGNVDEAKTIIRSVEAVPAGRSNFDDALVIAGMKYRLLNEFGLETAVGANTGSLAVEIDAYRGYVERLGKELDGLKDVVSKD